MVVISLVLAYAIWNLRAPSPLRSPQTAGWWLKQGPCRLRKFRW
jgi:hypothetical protein